MSTHPYSYGADAQQMRYVRFATALFGGAGAMALVAALNPALTVAAIGWALMTLALVGPLWMDPALRRQAFHPYSYFIFNGVVVFSVPTLLLFLDRPLLTQSPAFAWGLLLVAGAFVAFRVGYRSRAGAALARVAPLLVFDRERDLARSPGFWVTAAALYGVGWIGRLARASLGLTHLPVDLGPIFRYASLLSDLHTFAILTYIVVAYVLLRQWARSPWAWGVLLAIMAMEVMAGTIDGGRTAIVLPALQFVVVFHFAVRPVRWRALLAAYVGAYVLLAPFLTLYRESYYMHLLRGETAGVQTVVSSVGHAMYRIGVGEFEWREVLEGSTADRATSLMEGNTLVMEKVPALHPHQYGATFGPGLAAMFIPRIVWPEKPIFLPGRDFAKRFFEVDTDKIFGTSIAIGMPAESFYNFSWLGILMFLGLGAFFRFFAERLWAYRRVEPTYIVRVFFVLFLLTDLTSAFVMFFGGVVREAVVYLVFLTLITRQVPRLVKPAALG